MSSSDALSTDPFCACWLDSQGQNLCFWLEALWQLRDALPRLEAGWTARESSALRNALPRLEAGWNARESSALRDALPRLEAGWNARESSALRNALPRLEAC